MKAARGATYFTGAPCKNGHISTRYLSNSMCVECVRIKNKEPAARSSQKAWVVGNRERWRIYGPRCYQKHLKQRREYANWYYKTHSKRSRMPGPRAYSLQNSVKTFVPRIPCERCGSSLRYTSNYNCVACGNNESMRLGRKRWEFKNRDKISEIARNRRARLSAAEGSHSAADINDLLILQRWRCACGCGRSVRRIRHVDHIQPLSKNGRNDRKNLQILAPTCNLKKGAKDPIEWAQSLGKLL